MSAEDVDPSDFVKRIQSLSKRRDEEDAVRMKELEERIAKDREERLARRAERARSISPEKDTTPRSSRSVIGTPTKGRLHDSPSLAESSTRSTPRDQAVQDTLDALTGPPTPDMDPRKSMPPPPRRDESPSAAMEPTKPTPNTATALARSGTLTWNRRPGSQTGSVRRPLSMVAARNSAAETNAANSPKATPDRASGEQKELSRDEIAKSLGGKDPSWFKQTADRGISSAAYRKNQVEDAPEPENNPPIGRRMLPGLSRETTPEPGIMSPPQDITRSTSPAQTGSTRDSTFSNRYSSSTSTTSGGNRDSRPMSAKSPLPALDSQKFAPPHSDTSSQLGDRTSDTVRELAMSPAQGRISPERMDRPASPTKGMGGFVQSAIMKRSDSQKRWSANPTPSLSRQSSTASNRSSAYGGMREGYTNSVSLPRLDARPSALTRENSPSVPTLSRPTSSHSNATITQDDAVSEAGSAVSRPERPSRTHSRAKSVISLYSTSGAEGTMSPPASPSKRWSPTKSSWLENALQRPESPSMKAPPPNQPSWMVELQKARQQKSSVDLKGQNALDSKKSPTSESENPISDAASRLKKAKSAAPLKTPVKEEPAKEAAKPAAAPKPLSYTSRPPVKDELAKEPLEATAPKALSYVSKQPVQEELQKPKPLSFTSKQQDKENPEKPLPATTPMESPEETSKPEPLSTKPKEVAEKPISPPVEQTPVTSAIQPRPVATKPAFNAPAPKPKSDTLPKHDFRANLKSRQTPTGGAKQEEPEFKNVFGKLKRAQPEKFVAEDELKNNILRGKAGLNLTGGVPPRTKKDELRDSLIAQKEAIKAKAVDESKPVKEAENPPTPEALAKRRNLSKSEAIKVPPPAEKKDDIPEALARVRTMRGNTVTTAPPKPEPVREEPAPVQLPGLKQTAMSSKLAGRFNPALAGMLARGPSPLTSGGGLPKPSSDTATTSTTSGSAEQDAGSGSTRQLEHKTKGRARGPKRRAPGAKAAVADEPVEVDLPVISLVKSNDVLPSSSRKAVEEVEKELVGSAPLALSKSAPLPKAKAPELASQVRNEDSSATPRRSVSGAKPITPVKSPRLSGITASSISETISESKPRVETPPKAAEPPTSAVKSFAKPAVRALPNPPSPAATSKPTTPSLRSQPPRELPAPIANKALPDVPPETRLVAKPPASVRNVAALWNKQPESIPDTPPRTKSPIKLPTRADEERLMENAGLRQSKELPAMPVGLGLGLSSIPAAEVVKENVATESVSTGPKYPMSPPNSGPLPPRPGKKPENVPTRPASIQVKPTGASVKAPPESPIPHTSEAGRLFADFFDELPATPTQMNIDTQAVLTSSPLDASKIKTLRKQIQEISGDGKLASIPPQEEYILFEDSMYICTHVFGSATGARVTEVYLWTGAGVSQSTVEDVQLFAKRVARDSSGKLIVLKQGKETPAFLQALGGIVITRKGSFWNRNRPYMLCCRQHLGHIAFDEVDLSLSSLCSGFSYIVYSPSGQLFLWKGHGCNAEELGSARLIGMDLASGHNTITEIDEGKETSDFLSVFPPPHNMPRSAGHWRKKASCANYNTRLFRIDQVAEAPHGLLQVSNYFSWARRPSWSARRGSSTPTPPQTPNTPHTPSLPNTNNKMKVEVTEIAPYSQDDVEPEKVYVLDAFFEIYIILGALAKSQHQAFSTALLFAQDYGILAASLEDRPIVPVSTVVLEGVPRDMKACFRSWNDNNISTGNLMAGKPKRGKSLRVVGLAAAIAATRQS